MSQYDYRVGPLPQFQPPPLYPVKTPTRSWVNALLFFATVLTTVFAGVFLSHFDSDFFRFWATFKYHPEWLLDGLSFSIPLMAILLSHEMGHYLVSRYHGVHSSLPYFIPGPSLVGTFGAVILMKSRIPNRRALFDIGAAGPLAGLAVALFTMVLGFATARVDIFSKANYPQGLVVFSPSIILGEALKLSGHFNADLMYSSPLLDAASVGLLVTMLNLLPIGQLDGGHIAYAVLGRRTIWLTGATFIMLLFLGIFWPAWIFMGVLLIALTGVKGLRHPPPDNPEIPLTRGRLALAVVILVIFIAILAPVPVSVIAY